MKKILITVGSITTAMRFKKLLNRRGIPAEVLHTPTTLNNGNCSYSLRLSVENISPIREISREYRLNIKGIYREIDDIKGEKRYHAIS